MAWSSKGPHNFCSPSAVSPGCLLGISWVLLGAPGCCCVLPGAPGRSWVLLGFPGRSWVHPGCLLGVPGAPWCCWVIPMLLDAPWCWGVSWVFMGVSWVLWVLLVSSLRLFESSQVLLGSILCDSRCLNADKRESRLGSLRISPSMYFDKLDWGTMLGSSHYM